MDQVLGYVATTMFTLMMVPQLIKTLIYRDARGLSWTMLVIGIVANIVAFVYATLIGQPPLQIKYVLAFIVLLACLIAYLRCPRKS